MLTGYTTDGHELVVRTGTAILRLTPYTPRAVRVRTWLIDGPQPTGAPSLIVVAEPRDVPFTVEEDERELRLRTAELTVTVDRVTGALAWFDREGTLLTREPRRGGRTLEPVDVHVSVFDEAETVESRENVDGVRIDAVNVRRVVDRRAYHAKLEFEWAPDEALYGLGSHEEGMFNLRGQHQYLYQQNMKASVPILVSTRGYGVLLDSTSLVTFHDDAFGSYLWSDVDDELDYYVVAGPELDGIVAELRALTGAPPMLPRWAFGYIQSKERYVDAAELLEVVREHRRRGLPLDCIVLDWKSWTGELWGQKTLDPERFPDPDRMTADIHAEGARLMVSIWPIMRPGGEDWQELKDKGLLLGNGATCDAFNPEARACYWDQCERGLFRHGIDAWWTDCTEPFESDWTGAVKPEPEERLRINTEESRRYLDPERINAYSLLHSQGLYEGQRATGSPKRVVNLTRSAFPGQQRYATITWSGDVAATWDTLRRQVAEGLSFCATGMPYWTTDVGAFFVKRDRALWFWAGDYDEGVADLGYRELYVRWFQFGVFLPTLRSHGTDTPREAWRFGEAGEPFYDALASALRLRSRLVPYLYALAGATTHRGYTMLRALPFDFRADPAVREMADEYMLGPAFLVCPVTRPALYGPGSAPIADGPTTRPVYLPAGTGWWDFATGAWHAGGTWIEAETPLERIPVFVRAGSIVPMGPVRQHVDDLPDAPLEVHVWPGADAAFVLYEDAGDGYAYETGESATTELAWDDAGRRLVIGERTGAYAGMPAERELVVVVHGEGAGDADALPGAAARVTCRGERLVVTA